ncbi:MAG: DUF2309 domain-containing protein [Cyclobacteriaceae bacterium]|nr:DUF2309 domain-containing protein [Cyclobacteriaceae bacterium]
MKTHTSTFDEHVVLHELKHYLPAQAPLKDFIHHNTLHAFQNLKFHEAVRKASQILGYRVSLSLHEFRAMYHSGRIREDVLDRVIIDRFGKENLGLWKERALDKLYGPLPLPRIGQLRAGWKRYYQIDLDSMVHPLLFRTVCSFMDQGISMWSFPINNKSFLDSIREMERNSFTSFFKTSRARMLLLETPCTIAELLEILVGDQSLFNHYLFDQQFAHQGWAGMVSTVEDVPQTLLDRKNISLKDLIIFECLLEIDSLDQHFGEDWTPLSSRLPERPVELFAEVQEKELDVLRTLWQEAYEWSYYNEVLNGILLASKEPDLHVGRTFQAMFCIDDRECSFRRYIEHVDPDCQTFATPGFFSVEFFYQPQDGKFYTKLCPWPVTPKYLIKEVDSKSKREKDVHFSKQTHSLLGGFLITHTLGFWSALKLFINIFKPSMGPATASSFRHMDKFSRLTIENKNPDDKENGLQVGFTIPEMITRAEGLLKSIGLVEKFAPIVYLIGHGSSSINNPHFAAYDCGACSGRAGSVNSRVMCYMINHPEVRKGLAERGIRIPDETQFVGGLHDTTRDEIMFFDENSLSPENKVRHVANHKTFDKALDLNAKERSRRFISVDTTRSPEEIHEEVRLRSVSLFEPRPELNHATNALCIVGRRAMTTHLFLDRRAFMNSFNYQVDPEGKYLYNILKAAAPVCGGINLEYFFSRVDNQKLGAGTKLPHNVMGLFGVANGIDGDLRPGLPSQMIEVHDPVRLLIIVEHFPEVVLKTIQTDAATYEWFINEWVHLIVVNPETRKLYRFRDGAFTEYQPLPTEIRKIDDMTPLIEKEHDNLPVYVIS